MIMNNLFSTEAQRQFNGKEKVFSTNVAETNVFPYAAPAKELQFIPCIVHKN